MKRGPAQTSRFDLSRRGDAAVLVFRDSHYHADSLENLTNALKDAEAAAAAAVVVVDLDRVLLLSSTALRALRASHQRLEARGGRIVAAGGGELVAGVLKFAPFIAHYPTPDEAARAVGGDRAAVEDER